MYRLYGRPSSGSFAVQVALEEIGTPFERIWVGTDAADIARYRKINPTGKVPALVLQEGTVMFESAAMLIYLAAAHPATRLAPPPGSAAYGRFLQWMVFLSANLYESALRMYYAERYSVHAEQDAAAIRDQGAVDFLAHLTLIADSLGPYVMGDEFSIADPYLYMLASWYSGDKAQLYAHIPKIAAHAALMLARPTVAKVEADQVR